MIEPKKVPISRSPSPVILHTCVHLIAILGAVVIISLNLWGIWIGKELQGSVSKDGQKLFAIQFTAKVHEQLVFASLSHVVWSALLSRLTAGIPVPLGSLGAGIRFQDASYVFSKEFRAFCTADFRGKPTLLLLLLVTMIFAVTVGPSSATAMTPILDDWPAGDVSFAINATQGDMWPRFITESTTFRHQDSAWMSLELNLFSFWGHRTVGGIMSMPETASLPSPSSVRTFDVRFRGPFSLYQPEVTAVSVQMAFVADAVNNIRQAWFWNNANQCAWAKGRALGGQCTYQDIQWTSRAQQPVVYAGCHRVEDAQTMMFPTLSQASSLAPVGANVSSGDSAMTSGLQWIDLPGVDFLNTSVGVLVQTSAFSGPGSAELYSCAIDAQWAYANVRTTFLGTPYAVSGSPPAFFAPQVKPNTYEGSRVKIDPKWATHAIPAMTLPGFNTTVFDSLLRAGSPQNGQAKIEAVVAVLVAGAMSSLNSDAIILGDLPDRDKVLASIQTSAKQLKHDPRYSILSLRTTVTGYAYGISSAKGVSLSSLLSVLILCCYVLIATTFLVSQLCSAYHVTSWNGFTDMVALALHSSPGPDMRATSAGVGSIDTLRLPVLFAARDDSVEMVIGRGRSIPKAPYRMLERGEAYS